MILPCKCCLQLHPPALRHGWVRWGRTGWRRFWWALPVCNECKYLGCARCA